MNRGSWKGSRNDRRKRNAASRKRQRIMIAPTPSSVRACRNRRRTFTSAALKSDAALFTGANPLTFFDFRIRREIQSSHYIELRLVFNSARSSTSLENEYADNSESKYQERGHQRHRRLRPSNALLCSRELL